MPLRSPAAWPGSGNWECAKTDDTRRGFLLSFAAIALAAGAAAPEARGGQLAGLMPVLYGPPPVREVDRDECDFEAANTARFEAGRFDLDEKAARTVDLQIDWLQRHPEATVTLEGHSEGPDAAGAALQRAKAVKDYMTKNGIVAERIAVKSVEAEKSADPGRADAKSVGGGSVTTVLNRPR